MTCQEIRDLFSARADDALDAEERARLGAHLATCADCGREWRRFEATVGLLRAVEPARAPVGFVDRVMAARPLPWYHRLVRGLLVPWPVKLPLQAAAVVLIAGLAVLVFQRSPDLQQAARAPEQPVTARTPEMEPRAQEPPPAPGGSGAATRPAADTAPPAPTPAANVQAPATVPELPAAARQESAAAPSPPSAVAAPPPAAQEPKREAAQDRLAKESPVAGLAKPGEDAAQPAVPAPPPPAVAAPRAGQAAGRSEGLRRDQRVTAVAQIEARLATPDRAAAEREIRAVVARLGGVVTSAPESLEIVVPGAAWDELARELGRLGTLRIERRQAELPSAVRVTVRLE